MQKTPLVIFPLFVVLALYLSSYADKPPREDDTAAEKQLRCPCLRPRAAPLLDC